MLNWCKNGQQNEERSEILIAVSPTTEPPPLRFHHQPPKFSCPTQKQIRKIKPTPRRTSVPQNQVGTKVDKQVQACLEPPSSKVLMDSGVQTQYMPLQLLSTNRNSRVNYWSQEPTPRNRLQNSVYLRMDYPRHPEYIQIQDRSRKQSGDCLLDKNLKTKATCCMVDTKDKMQFCGKSKIQGLFGVESYQFPVSKITEAESFHPLRQVKFKESQIISRQEQSICLSREQRPCDKQSEYNVGQRYRQIFRNVQNEFKKSQQRSEKFRSLKNFMCTPHRPDRRLLYQRETIMSKFSSSRVRSDQQLLVEQSVIMERQIGSRFVPLTSKRCFEGFSLCLARENETGLLVSIKQLSMGRMDDISEELLVYKELEDRGIRAEVLLELYQTQLDHSSFMFIKEPYTDFLEEYVRKTSLVEKVMKEMEKALTEVLGIGFVLRRQVKVQDFVMVQQKVKIQSVDVFALRVEGGISLSLGVVLQSLWSELIRKTG